MEIHVTKFKKFSVAGIASAILAIAAFASVGEELTACNANTKGLVAQWASLHPGLNRKEECLKLGAVAP